MKTRHAFLKDLALASRGSHWKLVRTAEPICQIGNHWQKLFEDFCLFTYGFENEAREPTSVPRALSLDEVPTK